MFQPSLVEELLEAEDAALATCSGKKCTANEHCCEDHVCIDDNECANNEVACGENGRCVNTEGSYRLVF